MHGYSASFGVRSITIDFNVAIYMHGYSASSGAEVLFVIWLVAILHMVSWIISTSKRKINYLSKTTKR